VPAADPRSLAIVVGVHVDPAGRHQMTLGVDDAARGTGLAAHLRDDRAIDGEIAGETIAAGAIDDRSGADDEIVA